MTMSQNEILSTLRAFRLTEAEWSTLTVLRDIHDDPEGHGMSPGGAIREWCRINRASLDMLILAGLVVRDHAVSFTTGDVEWFDTCYLTEQGEWAASAVNMVFDWDGFTYLPEGEETDFEAPNPESVAAGVEEAHGLFV